MRYKNETEKARALALYLEGIADASEGAKAERLSDAAEFLNKLADEMCGQGYVCCRGGEQCESDHK